MHYLPNDTSASNSALIIPLLPVEASEAEHPTLIRAELSGGRRCSAVGIVVNAYAPVLTLARQLIRAGFPPDRILEVYRGATLCFCVPLAVAARLTVKDDKDGVPRFKNYVPFPADRVAPPIAPNDLAATPLAEPLQKTPSAGGAAHG